MMPPDAPHPVVHLELQTPNLACACAFYTRLFGWRTENVHVGKSSYLALEMGDIAGGVAESDASHPLWLPYVEVPRVADAVDRAVELGGAIVLEPREGPAGWRSIVCSPAAGPIALWERKRGYEC